MQLKSMSPVMGQTNEKGKLTMDKLESLRAGIAEMRTVAQKLSRWADWIYRCGGAASPT